MKQLTVTTSSKSYRILIENNLLSWMAEPIRSVYQGNKIYIITDERVAELYLDLVKNRLADQFSIETIVIPQGESSKCLKQYEAVCEELLKKEIRRNELILSLGGGVVGDLAGFVAATLYRGLPYIQVPTTLLAQVDASIGGKTGMDFYHRKNIIGAFKQPELVLIDPLTIQTLPVQEFRNGMGELIKHAFIGSPFLLEQLKKNHVVDETMIYESLCIKKKYVEMDEWDQNERMFLNFGHTFGHMIEMEEQLKHGEAVGLGMLMALQMGIDLQYTPASCYETLRNIMDQYGLNTEERAYRPYLKQAVYDKKNLAGTIRFVLLKQIGEPVFYTLSEKMLSEENQ